MSDITTPRGRFRSIDMDVLRATTNDPIWDDEKSSLSYTLPIKEDEDAIKSGLKLAEGMAPEELSQIGPFTVGTSPQSHIGPFKHAIDFLVSDGSTVVAAQDGTVIEVEDIAEKWGDGPEYRDYLNYITIQHTDGEYTQYCHLAKGSVRELGIEAGQRVTKGQAIALVGKTGWTDRDHLHFIVFQESPNTPFGFKSVLPRFACVSSLLRGVQFGHENRS